MTNKVGNGGGIPVGWSVARAVEAQRKRGDPTVEVARAKPMNLVAELVRDNRWPVRNQGHRATCSAFAVVAAEELANWQVDKSRDPVPLSEEYMYKSMREKSLDQVETDNAVIAASGTTFLFQAKAVLETDGVVLADGLAYDSSTHLAVNHTIKSPPPRKNVLAASGQRFVHNIAENPSLQPTVDWKTPIPRFTSLVDTFLRQLSRKVPVIASFAILEPPGGGVFTSAEAQSYGEVEYPPSEFAKTLEPVAGHTVCIVGYVPRDGAAQDGWFIFRNSYGTVRFGFDAERDKAPPVAPAPGYGTISAADVDLYCWEYLYRA